MRASSATSSDPKWLATVFIEIYCFSDKLKQSLVISYDFQIIQRTGSPFEKLTDCRWRVKLTRTNIPIRVPMPSREMRIARYISSVKLILHSAVHNWISSALFSAHSAVHSANCFGFRTQNTITSAIQPIVRIIISTNGNMYWVGSCTIISNCSLDKSLNQRSFLAARMTFLRSFCEHISTYRWSTTQCKKA